jgi:hypothetical protein
MGYTAARRTRALAANARELTETEPSIHCHISSERVEEQRLG